MNTFKHGEIDYSVTHMAHSDTPEFDKTVYSTRNYGRFGSYARATLTADEPLVYYYRILVATIAPTTEKTQTAYDAWTKK